MTKQKKSGKKTSGGRSSLDTSKVQTLDGRRGMSVTTRFIGMLVAIACVFLLMYIQDYHRAEKSVASATVSTQDVVVEKGDAAMVFRPVQGGDTGLIFYPGSKVQHTAYAPLMQMLAQRGVFCVLVEMPFRLPLLDRSAAGVYPADYPEIKNWFLGGHSLGGNVAADYAAKHPEELTGLGEILFVGELMAGSVEHVEVGSRYVQMTRRSFNHDFLIRHGNAPFANKSSF